MTCPVSNRRWDAQLDLRAGSGCGPNIQRPANASGPLTHSRYTVVACASFFRYDFRIDALSIIPDVQLEQASAISDIHFDIARLRVVKSIPHRLTGNREDLVPQDRMQVSCWALHHEMKLGGIGGGQL